MNKEELFTAIKQEIDFCETTRLPSNPSFTPTEQHRLELIDRYMMSKYRDGDQDSFGNQMVFYNIVSYSVEYSAKLLDFDTKDILLIAEDDRYWETWLMEKELRMWMEENKFSNFLNEFCFRLPRDGQVVSRNIDGKIELVPLKNLRYRPNSLELEDTPIIEKYEYQPDEFIAKAKEKKWDNWQKVSLQPDKVDVGYFNKVNKVTIFGAWFPEGYLDYENNYFLVSYDGHILHESQEDLFYKGVRWEKVMGRLMGRGVVEKLFNEQIYLNRIANYKADGLNWTSKHWFQTRDNTFKQNLLGNSDNGDVFTTNEPLEPVAVEERNLSFYTQEEQRWEESARKRTFTGELAIGPRTSQASVMFQAQSLQTYFEQKKEDIAVFIKDIIWDWIIPQFQKDVKGQHTLLMNSILTSEKGAEKFFNLNLNYNINKQKLGQLLPPEMWELKKALLAEEMKHQEITIPRGFYDDLKYKMKIVIGSEAFDIQGKLQTLQTILQIVGSNPAVFQNPTTKGIIQKMLNYAGFQPTEFEEQEVPQVQNVVQGIQAQRGGSIAAPQMPAFPQQVNQPMKV